MPVDELSTETLLLLFQALTGPDAVPAGVRDPMVRLQLRALGLGTYVADEAECATRRVDLEHPADVDPGPLPMEEADAEEEAVWLELRADA